MDDAWDLPDLPERDVRIDAAEVDTGELEKIYRRSAQNPMRPLDAIRLCLIPAMLESEDDLVRRRALILGYLLGLNLGMCRAHL